jgi:hypothetical protein
MDKKMQYMMYLCLSSIMKYFMYNVRHQCNCVFIQQLKNTSLQQYMDVWMHECSTAFIKSLFVSMIERMNPCMKHTINEQDRM